MNSTMCKIVGVAQKLNKSVRDWNREMEDPASMMNLDDGYYKWCERDQERLECRLEEQMIALNAQLGAEGLKDPMEWFRRIA